MLIYREQFFELKHNATNKIRMHKYATGATLHFNQTELIDYRLATRRLEHNIPYIICI